MPRSLLIASALLLGCGNSSNPADAAVDLAADLSATAPTTLASAQTLTPCLAVDAKNVYWADQGSGDRVLQVSITAGGAATTLASGGGSRTCVIVDSQSAYFTDEGDSDAGTPGDVLGAKLSGGGTMQLATDVHPKSRLASDGTNLYFITDLYGPMDMAFSGKDALVRMPVGGGAPEVVYSDLTPPEAEELFVDAHNVYYSDGVAVTARDKNGSGTPITFGMGTLHGTSFVTDGAHLLMVESTGIGQGNLVVYATDGSGRVVLTPSTGTPLAVDASSAYVNLAGHLVRFALDGSSMTTLDANGVRALVTDAESLYFTDGASILKLGK